MRVLVEKGELKASVNLDAGNDISIAVRKDGNVNCYYLSDPEFKYFESPQFVGSLAKGGSVNCERISLYAHASGTHTECALHVLPVNFDMRHVQIPSLQFARLITVMPERMGEDFVITAEAMKQLTNPEGIEALVVRTLPNEESKLTRNYSDTNPVYFEPEALGVLRDMGFKHLITDIPSIDKESDEGRLAAHKNWFTVAGEVPADRTVTELVYVPDTVADGLYVLSMQVPSIETDAVPSRIILYSCV